MMRPQYTIIVYLLLCNAALLVFSYGDDNFDSYCGKTLTLAQNNCSLRCASGTDQECIDSLGVEYKCFPMTGCSERIKKSSSREVIHATSRRTAGDGICASTLEDAIMGCDYGVACSGDLDCGVGEICYSDICGYPLMELYRYAYILLYMCRWIDLLISSQILLHPLSTSVKYNSPWLGLKDPWIKPQKGHSLKLSTLC